MKRRLLILCLILAAALIPGCGGAEGQEPSPAEGAVSEEAAPESDPAGEEEPIKENKPIFYTKSLEAIEVKNSFRIKDCYITNKVTGLNRYYIDENKVLWGTGQNWYGQLGNGEATELNSYEAVAEPVQIAENVVSVDCSVNGYFCIYLTEDGDLYGMGVNLYGLLGEEYNKTTVQSMDASARVTTPVLLMEDVAYARAAREAIVALKEDGSVWWWGQYCSVYQTEPRDYRDYTKMIEDDQNPAKMLYTAPKKLLDDCIYATTGDWTGAAISKDGGLYTWGLNVFGECGTPVTEDDYVRTPQKVLEKVRMVWPEELIFNSVETEIPEEMWYETKYIMNVFVQLENGEIEAAGQNLGEKERTIGLTGDLVEESAHHYSDTFIPVEIADVSEMPQQRAQ